MKAEKGAQLITDNQKGFIADMAVAKLKELKELKELVDANQLTKKPVRGAESLGEITADMTAGNASRLIDILSQRPAPTRNSYSNKRMTKMADIVDDIERIIDDWDFNSLGGK